MRGGDPARAHPGGGRAGEARPRRGHGAAAHPACAARAAADASVDHGRLAEAVLRVGDVRGDAGVVHCLEIDENLVLGGFFEPDTV